MSEGQDFWSRRRAAVAAEARVETDAAPEMERPAPDVRDDAEILQELNLPDPDALEAEDDISAFMDRLVPDHLRRRALRRFWRLNPVLANLDGLVDYGEDFTDSATVIENLQSAYQVGKGMLSHIEAMAASEEVELPAPAADPEAEIALAEPVPEAAPAAETGEEAVPVGDPDEHVAPPAPRRMRFDIHPETESVIS